MMDVSEYESLMEKLELLTDIQIAESQIKKGEGETQKDAKAQVLGKLNENNLVTISNR